MMITRFNHTPGKPLRSCGSCGSFAVEFYTHEDYAEHAFLCRSCLHNVTEHAAEIEGAWGACSCTAGELDASREHTARLRASERPQA